MSFFLIALFTACTPNTASTVTSTSNEVTSQTDRATITVYRSPTWGCCGEWIDYVRDNGYTVEVNDVQNLGEIKSDYQIPTTLQACHTAIVDGYIIEGHVPIAEVERLLSERPDIAGLAVPGMPVGSPGMESSMAADQPFDVIAFDTSGNLEVFAQYGNW